MWLLGLYRGEASKLGIEEFREIFLAFFPELCLYASKFVGDLDASKDVVQDVFTKFWEENDKLFDKNRIKPYLYKAVKNRSLNYKKREKRKMGIDEIFDSFNVDVEDSTNLDNLEALSYKNLQNKLEKAISELPKHRQKIFRMSRFQQMKHKEIAEELGISPKTVETQIYRSLNFLRERLKNYLS